VTSTIGGVGAVIAFFLERGVGLKVSLRMSIRQT
jgi:hypothetical protein